VTGNASTTAVTVNQTATGTGLTATATTAGVVGYAAGVVTIADANATTATVDTIATVSLNSYGASTIASDALTTLNLSSTGGTLGINGGAADATQVATTLALNVNGLTGAAIGLSDPYTTLNLDSTTTKSTIANVTAAGVTTLNVSGDALVTLTNNTFGALTSVVSTNTAGVTLGTTALGANVTFTGGTGNDSIILSNAFTKAMTMGDGNDSVGYGGAASVVAGLVGSVAAGDGTDTIRMTAAQADAADATAAFNTAFTGFEVLDVTAAAADVTVNLAGINGVNSVVARGISAANTLTLDGFATNGTLTLDTAAAGAASAYAVNVTNAVLTAGDVFNVALSNSTGGAVTFGTVTAAGIDTLNISTVDAGTTTALKAATIDALVLGADAQLLTLNVSGNNGLTITNDAANVALTTFNASGVVADDASTIDTAANLAVSFSSANTTAAATVTITGGAGNDVLTGNAAKDTIIGGAGADQIDGKAGVDTLTGGLGIDVFTIGAGEAGITGGEKITDFAIGLLGDNLNLSTTTLVANQTATDVTAAVAGAVDVTATVLNGIITLGGGDMALVDTVGEIKAIFELIDDNAAADVAAIVLNGQTYVMTDTIAGAVNDIIQLAGVTSATSLAAASAEGTILIS
jgi:S-layer protein